MESARRWASAVAVTVVVLAAVAFALAFTAAPASAFGDWDHESVLAPNPAFPCTTCHTGTGTPTDTSCTGCHSGFKAFSGTNCWTCHVPGQSTATLSSPSTACSQECHLWNETDNTYNIPFTHGDNPHLGSEGGCTNCHTTSTSAFNPAGSPHHTGQPAGFTKCSTCHSSQRKHAGTVACTVCHATAEAFHTYKAASPGFKNCSACHTKKHAGRKIAMSKCSACHKSTISQPVQHSNKITKKFKCGGCHGQVLHASKVSRAVKSCRTCHTAKYHAKQPVPSRSVCTKCHSRALSHANGFQCTLCHRRAVHNARPSAIN